jgi:hypothetical protein
VSEGRLGEGTGAEQAARSHAEHVVRRDPQAREDLAPGADVTPPDLVEWLLGHSFKGFELVAHARIGAHHIFKTKFVGPTTLVVQARWAAEAGGAGASAKRRSPVEGGPAGAPRSAPRPGEV